MHQKNHISVDHDEIEGEQVTGATAITIVTNDHDNTNNIDEDEELYSNDADLMEQDTPMDETKGASNQDLTGIGQL